jgi:hypothetical protein
MDPSVMTGPKSKLLISGALMMIFKAKQETGIICSLQ